MSLPLELVNFCFSVSDLRILLSNVLVERLDLILETLQCVLLLFDSIILVIDISLQAFHVSLDIIHLVLDKLELSLRLKCHIMYLALVLLILVMNLFELLIPILFNLSNGHLIAINQLLVVFLLFVDLRLLVLHFLLVLFFLEKDLVLVVRLDLFDCIQEVFMLTLLLSLQL